jgi:photosystem II stability/assembly factor-like uncharacterized protein
MVVQSPQRSSGSGPDIEAGVIQDARARQLRHRRVGAGLAVALLLAGLAAATWGGGGTTSGKRTRHRQPGVGAGTHSAPVASRAVPGVPPYLSQFGLLAPGVGWGANGLGFYITRDGGERWRDVDVPGLGVGGDITANLRAGAVAKGHVLAVAFAGNGLDGTCLDRNPGEPASRERPLGGIAVSLDSGRRWRSAPFQCQLPYALSLLNGGAGFALVGGPREAWLYASTDGFRSWHRVAATPALSSIDFTSTVSGWGVSSTGPSQRGVLYRTTDGGETWGRASICQGAEHGAVTIRCENPIFFTPDQGLVLAVAVDRVSGRDRLLIYTTSTGGRSWSARTVPVGKQLRRYVSRHQPVPYSAPGPDALYVFVNGYLYTTADLGGRWSRLRQEALRGYGQLDFASSAYGWISVGNHFDYTSDGGRRWTAMGAATRPA